MATTAYVRVLPAPRVRHPPAKAGLKGVHRQDCRRHASHHLPLYQDKAVTPTPLKDIFTSIWAGPYTYLTDVKRFLFNVLLFLGSLPEEYEPDQVLRAVREKKGHLRPELRAARFLGKEAYRPARQPTEAEHEATGRQLPGHWRAGHWRRQTFGEGSLQRKLIWIQPYKTAGPDA
jgi:hypothetical protein